MTHLITLEVNAISQQKQRRPGGPGPVSNDVEDGKKVAVNVDVHKIETKKEDAFVGRNWRSLWI